MEREIIENAIASFNKKSKEKAKLVEAGDAATVEFSGIEKTEDAQKYFEAFRLMLEKETKLPIAIKKVQKTNGSHTVVFFEDPSPADEIISRLGKYYEGVTRESDADYED